MPSLCLLEWSSASGNRGAQQGPCLTSKVSLGELPARGLLSQRAGPPLSGSLRRGRAGRPPLPEARATSSPSIFSIWLLVLPTCEARGCMRTPGAGLTSGRLRSRQDGPAQGHELASAEAVHGIPVLAVLATLLSVFLEPRLRPRASSAVLPPASASSSRGPWTPRGHKSVCLAHC